MRISSQSLEIMRTLESLGSSYGLEIERQADGVPRGTVYVTLRRLAAQGLVSSEQETPRPHQAGMPRRFWKLTARGTVALKAETAAQKILGEGARTCSTADQTKEDPDA